MQGAAAWLTVKVCPATATAPLRAMPAALRATEYVTLPVPLPLLGVLIDDAWLVACHAQPIGEVTVKVPPPPVLPTVALVGERLYVQGAAAWVTVRVCPATTIDPLRDAAAGFGSTE